MRILLAAAAVLSLAACDDAGTDTTSDIDATADVATDEALMPEEGGEDAAPAEGADAAEAADQAKAPAKPAPAGEKWQQITITGFECGDNCYLIYSRSNSTDEESALCEASACDPWFEVQEMPQAMVGKRAQAVFSVGEQVDGAGTVMSDDFPAITKLKL